MRDRIISVLLTIIIIAMLVIIGYIGYKVYTEIAEEGTIEIYFESDTGFPTIDYIPHKNKNDVILDDSIFSGVQETIQTATAAKQSRYLYQQLDDSAKIFYSKLYENKENLKTGTYKVEFGNTFQTVLSKEGGEAELKAQYQSAIEALVYENPDIFYLDVTKMYINIEKTTKITGPKYNVYIDCGNEISYLEEGFYSKEDIEKCEEQIKNIKDAILSSVEGKSDYQKIKIIHDYLIDNIEYETDLNQNNVYNICGALINKKCVCEGYAKAFQYLMDEAGIENTIIIGIGTNSKNQTENHAWNYVKLDGKWYAVDVTWDDPIISGGGKLSNKSRYEYFLRGSDTMNKNHVPSGKFTEEGQVFTYPELNIEDYE